MNRKFILSLGLASLLVAGANAQWFLRGQFNSWGTSHPMTHMGGGKFQATMTGTPGSTSFFKVGLADWSDSAPGGDSRVRFDATGSAVVTFWDAPIADGWEPSTSRRVSYTGAYDWDLMGSVNGWASPFGTLTNLGGGLHSTTISINSGSYEFKFRKAGDWDVSVGKDFGTFADNIQLNVPSTGLYKFTMDQFGGRYKVEAVPEPATMAALGLGVAAMLRRRKK